MKYVDGLSRKKGNKMEKKMKSNKAIINMYFPVSSHFTKPHYTLLFAIESNIE